MNYVKEASSLMDKATEVLAQGTDKVKEFAGNPDVQKLLPYLLAGGVGAAGGAMLSGRRKKKTGESKSSYLMRILRNAAIAGGLAGGGSYLLGKGFENTAGAVDQENIITGSNEDGSPVGNGLITMLKSPAAAGAAGLSFAGATRGMQGAKGAKGIGALSDLKAAEKGLIAVLKQQYGGKLPDKDMDLAYLKGLSETDRDKFREVLRNSPNGTLSPVQEARVKNMEHNAKKLGLNPHIKGSVNDHAHNLAKPFSYLFGRTKGRRLGRLGLVGGVAALPAIAGTVIEAIEN